MMAAEQFVPVKGDGRVLDFEMADAPVTNGEYAIFVRATGHAAPQHWGNGGPPQGFENDPVIYVGGVTRTSSCEYRLWLARNMGAGYASYFEWEEGH